jgi:adenine phosphoribosyltransferase
MSLNKPSPAELSAAIRNVPDFPQPGIQFKDITPVLADGRLYAGCIEHLIGDFKPGSVDAVVGIDARGFIFAAAVALRLQCGFVPVRKKGKLPYQTYEQSYQLEYGSNTIAIHTDAVHRGSRVLLVDDLLCWQPVAPPPLLPNCCGKLALIFWRLPFSLNSNSSMVATN